MVSEEIGLFWQARTIPCLSFSRLKGSRRLSLLMTMSGVASTRSYVVNRLPQWAQTRRRRITVADSSGRESMTRSSGWSQDGQRICLEIPHSIYGGVPRGFAYR